MEDPESQDSTDGIIDSIKEIFQPIFDEFKVQIGENENFIGGVIRIFMILLSVNTSAPTKIKKVIKESINLVMKLWPEQKQQSEE